jgi:hypothetical protein
MSSLYAGPLFHLDFLCAEADLRRTRSRYPSMQELANVDCHDGPSRCSASIKNEPKSHAQTLRCTAGANGQEPFARASAGAGRSPHAQGSDRDGVPAPLLQCSVYRHRQGAGNPLCRAVLWSGVTPFLIGSRPTKPGTPPIWKCASATRFSATCSSSPSSARSAAPEGRRSLSA